MNTLNGHNEGDENDVILGHIMVHQDSHRHDGRRAWRHRRVHQYHVAVLREQQIEKEGYDG